MSTLTRANFREYAQRAVDKYAEKNMLVDSLLWAWIIGHFEAEIEDYRKLLAHIRKHPLFKHQINELIDEALSKGDK